MPQTKMMSMSANPCALPSFTRVDTPVDGIAELVPDQAECVSKDWSTG